MTMTDEDFLKKVDTAALDLIQEFIKLKARDIKRATGDSLTADAVAKLLRAEVDRRDSK